MAVKATIGIIGGTGVYSADVFKVVSEEDVKTPYGSPSDRIKIAEMTTAGDKISVAFLPRHGSKHSIPPHKVNYRANIWALRELGVKHIIGLCAVGSLKENMKPGDVVVPDQFIDFTKHRALTFHDGHPDPVAHVSAADPFCPHMRKTANSVIENLGIPLHKTGTYLCIEGPRFSTRAESKLWRTMADVVGMTLVPEVNLARDLELCYLSIASITDYDVWAEKPVSAADVIETMKKNNTNVQKIIEALVPKILPDKRDCICSEALKYAVVK